MKPLKIVSKNVIKNWWCARCSKAHNVLIKADNESFCELCVPEKYKGEVD